MPAGSGFSEMSSVSSRWPFLSRAFLSFLRQLTAVTFHFLDRLINCRLILVVETREFSPHDAASQPHG
jgi:hypothetical protein